MFNEIDYKRAWYGRHRGGPVPTHINNIAGTGGVDTIYAPGYGPNVVVETPGFRAPQMYPASYPPSATQPQAQAPAASANSPTAADSSSGIMETLTSLPWWVYAGAAYFLFFRKGR
jgi:hypothetical protein